MEIPPIKPANVPAAVAYNFQRGEIVSSREPSFCLSSNNWALTKKVLPSANANMQAVMTATPPKGNPILRKMCGLINPRASKNTQPRISKEAPTPIAKTG